MAAMEEWFAREPAPGPTWRLIYNHDGTIVGLSADKPKDDELYVVIDLKEFQSKYEISNKWLRYIDGKIVDTKPIDKPKEHQLVPGDTWHVDNDNRLIVGGNDGNNSGWSRKTD